MVLAKIEGFMTDEMLKLENQLCHRLYAISNAITRTYRPHLTELGLTYPQFLVMMALWEKENVAIQHLVAKTKIDGGSLTQVLSKMEKNELLSIHPSEEDRRKKMIRLTEKGKSLKEEAKHIPEKLSCKFKTVENSDFDKMIELLDKMGCDLEL